MPISATIAVASNVRMPTAIQIRPDSSERRLTHEQRRAEVTEEDGRGPTQVLVETFGILSAGSGRPLNLVSCPAKRRSAMSAFNRSWIGLAMSASLGVGTQLFGSQQNGMCAICHSSASRTRTSSPSASISESVLGLDQTGLPALSTPPFGAIRQ
jgi:hypothetical protein